MRKKYKVPFHVKNYIKKELYNYINTEKLIKEIEEQIIYENSKDDDGQPRGKNQISDPTEKKAMKIINSRDILVIRKRQLNIHNAFNKLEESEQKIVRSIFMQGHNQIYCETHEYITKETYYNTMNKMIYLTALEFELI